MSKSPVWAMVRRVNRRLKARHESDQIRVCRPDSKWFGELGEFYAVDNSDAVTARHVDLAKWAAELGPLTPPPNPVP